MPLNVDPRRCKLEGCKGWANKTTGYCAGHDPYEQAKAKAALELKRKGLNLPPLNSHENAKVWVRKVAEALAQGRIKQGLASELRRFAQTYAEMDPSGQIADRLEALEAQLAELKEAKESWRG